MTASVIDLRPSLPISLARTEMLHHQAYYKLDGGRNTLNKTNEHCRSLFNLLPASLRPRRTFNEKNDVDAVSNERRFLLHHIVLCIQTMTVHSFLIRTLSSSSIEEN